MLKFWEFKKKLGSFCRLVITRKRINWKRERRQGCRLKKNEKRGERLGLWGRCRVGIISDLIMSTGTRWESIRSENFKNSLKESSRCREKKQRIEERQPKPSQKLWKPPKRTSSTRICPTNSKVQGRCLLFIRKTTTPPKKNSTPRRQIKKQWS